MAYRRDTADCLLFDALKKELANIEHEMWRLRHGLTDTAIDQLDARARRLRERLDGVRAQSLIRLE